MECNRKSLEASDSSLTGCASERQGGVPLNHANRLWQQWVNCTVPLAESRCNNFATPPNAALFTITDLFCFYFSLFSPLPPWKKHRCALSFFEYYAVAQILNRAQWPLYARQSREEREGVLNWFRNQWLHILSPPSQDACLTRAHIDLMRILFSALTRNFSAIPCFVRRVSGQVPWYFSLYRRRGGCQTYGPSWYLLL